jgi:hypothetical protein
VLQVVFVVGGGGEFGVKLFVGLPASIPRNFPNRKFDIFLEFGR